MPRFTRTSGPSLGQKIASGISGALSGAKTGLDFMQDMQNQKQLFERRAQEMEQKKQDAIIAKEDRAQKGTLAYLTYYNGLSPELRKQEQERQKTSGSFNTLVQQGGIPYNAEALLNGYDDRDEATREAFSVLTKEMLFLGQGNLTKNGIDASAKRLEEAFGALKGKMNQENFRLYFEGAGKNLKEANDRLTKETKTKKDVIGVLLTPENERIPFTSMSQLKGKSELVGQDKQYGVPLYELRDDKGGKIDSSSQLLTKAIISLDTAFDQSVKADEAQGKFTGFGNFNTLLQEHFGMDADGIVANLFDKGAAFEAQFTKSFIPGLEGPMKLFAQAQILSAKAIVKAFDGSRPSDFDFRVIIQNVMPKLTDFDATQRGAFKQLLMMLKTFKADLDGVDSDEKTIQARANIAGFMIDHADVFGDDVKARLARSPEQESRDIAKALDEEPGTLKVDVSGKGKSSIKNEFNGLLPQQRE